MSICPCCKRKMPAPRAVAGQDKRLAQDLGKARAAIEACARAEGNPFFANVIVAIADERARLTRALADLRLLWSIYRRAEKNTAAPYYLRPAAVRKAA